MSTVFAVFHFAWGYGKFFVSFVEQHKSFDRLGSRTESHHGWWTETKATGIYNSKFKPVPHSNPAIDISKELPYNKIIGAFEPHNIQEFQPDYIQDTPNDIRVIVLKFEEDSHTIRRSKKYDKNGTEWWEQNSAANIKFKFDRSAAGHFSINMDRLLDLDENEYSKLCEYCDITPLENWKDIMIEYLKISG